MLKLTPVTQIQIGRENSDTEAELYKSGFFVDPQSAIKWDRDQAKSNPQFQRLFQDETALAELNFTRREVFDLLRKSTVEMNEHELARRKSRGEDTAELTSAETARLKEIAAVIFGDNEFHSAFGGHFVSNFERGLIWQLVYYAPNYRTAVDKLLKWENSKLAKDKQGVWQTQREEGISFDLTRPPSPAPTKEDLKLAMAEVISTQDHGRNKLEDVQEIAYQIALSRGYNDMAKIVRYNIANPLIPDQNYYAVNTPARIKDFVRDKVQSTLQDLLSLSKQNGLPIRTIYLLETSIKGKTGHKPKEAEVKELAAALLETLTKTDFFHKDLKPSAIADRIQSFVIKFLGKYLNDNVSFNIKSPITAEHSIAIYNKIGHELNEANPAYQFRKIFLHKKVRTELLGYELRDRSAKDRFGPLTEKDVC